MEGPVVLAAGVGWMGYNFIVISSSILSPCLPRYLVLFSLSGKTV